MCEILNSGERFRARDSPCRLFVPYSSDSCLASADLSSVQLITVPIISPSCPPFFFCFAFRQSKLLVVHPMKGVSVNYSDYIQPTKTRLIELLESRLPSVSCIDSMVPELFVPKSILKDAEIDNGLHLLHLLEHFNGSKTEHPISITTGTQLKRFALRVCHRIITCNDNLLRKKVEEAVQASSAAPQGHHPLPYSDDDLRKFIWDRKSNVAINEPMVSTPWMEVTRAGLQTLRPHGLVMDQVIDMFGIKCTLGQTHVLYLPTTVTHVCREKNPTIWNQYVKSTYLPADGSQIRKVFVPIQKQGHWWACVCDLDKKKNFVLNSSVDLGVDRDHATTTEILFNVAGVLERMPSFEHLRHLHMLDLQIVAVPQQKTTYDCGAFVLKYLAALDADSLWTNPNYFVNLPLFRKTVMLQLVRWDQNTRKVFH